MSMNSYYIWTIGCQMNKADSERLSSALESLGLEPSLAPSEADVVVLNSCVVRQSAEDKVTGMITSLKPLKLKYPDRILAVMGCMVGPKTDDLRKTFPYVDVFMPPQRYEPLIDMLGQRLGIDVEGCIKELVPPRPNVSTYVPIIHGCDEFCTFCIIPYRRGRQKSRGVDDIVHEISLLSERGVKEVTLLGQTVDAYGHDLDENVDLGDLLREVHSISGLSRIRFLTSHPRYMTDSIIQSVAELPNVCEHFNLPFQAGDDDILRDMRRSYSSDEYRSLVQGIRDMVPGASISTDVIVGFPGETDRQFMATLDLIRDIRFEKVHAAAYSARPGTIAFRKAEDNVPLEEKKSRLRALELLQESIVSATNSLLFGKSLEVLVEDFHKGQWRGRTRSDKLVFFRDGVNMVGKVVDVKISRTGPWSLEGELIGAEAKV